MGPSITLGVEEGVAFDGGSVSLRGSSVATAEESDSGYSVFMAEDRRLATTVVDLSSAKSDVCAMTPLTPLLTSPQFNLGSQYSLSLQLQLNSTSSNAPIAFNNVFRLTDGKTNTIVNVPTRLPALYTCPRNGFNALADFTGVTGTIGCTGNQLLLSYVGATETTLMVSATLLRDVIYDVFIYVDQERELSLVVKETLSNSTLSMASVTLSDKTSYASVQVQASNVGADQKPPAHGSLGCLKLSGKAKPKPKLDPKPKPNPKPKTEPSPKPKTEPSPKAKTEPSPKSQPKSNGDSKSKPSKSKPKGGKPKPDLEG